MKRATKNRLAFSLVELLVSVAIVGVLLAMLLPAVQQVREASNRMQCANHLKQLGTALMAYHELNKSFPHDYDLPNRRNGSGGGGFPPRFDITTIAGVPLPTITYPECGSVFVALLPFVEHANLFNPASADGLNGPAQPVPLYLCPSRRSVAVGPRTDYGEGQDAQFYGIPATYYYPYQAAGNGTLPCVQWDYPSDLLALGGAYAVMGNYRKSGLQFTNGNVVWPATDVTTLREIQQNDGTSHTLLMAHKGVEPRHYDGTGPNDEGYAHLGNYWEHKRYPGGFWKDQNGLSVGNNMYTSLSPLTPGRMPNSHQLMTSPHRSMPCLFADASVRLIGYDVSMDTVYYMWQYNDGRDRTQE